MASRTPSRIAIAVLAIWHSLKTLGKRYPLPVPHRILIANYLLLGDTLMLTPLLAKLRARYPNSEISMTVPKAIAPLYQHRPYGVHALVYDPKDIRSLWRMHKYSGFDLAIIPADNRYSWLARALGSRWVIAFAGDRPAYKSWPVDRLLPIPETPMAWGDLVAGILDGKDTAVYHPDAWPDPECASFPLPSSPYCVLHVGAGKPSRLWPGGRWRALADALHEKGYQVVWSGGINEEKLVSAIDAEARYTSYAGRLDLPQLWNLLKHACLLVCPDTGVAHLGRVSNTPTVALFGPGSSILFGAGEFWKNSPYRAVTVSDFPCRDQRSLFKRTIPWMRHCVRGSDECKNNLCMQAVTLDMVESAIGSLMDKHVV